MAFVRASAAPPAVRLGAWLLALGVAALALWLAALAGRGVRPWPAYGRDGAPVLSLRWFPQAAIRAPSAPRAAKPEPSSAGERSSQPALPPAVEDRSALRAALSAAACSAARLTRTQRAGCADAPAFGDARSAPALPVAAVEGLKTSSQKIAVAVATAIARRETYGQAQRYIDPREDPLYKSGADPSTSYYRPCPEGMAPGGDGHALNGRTCHPRQ